MKNSRGKHLAFKPLNVIKIYCAFSLLISLHHLLGIFLRLLGTLVLTNDPLDNDDAWPK